MILGRKTNKWYYDRVNRLQELVDIHMRSSNRWDVAGYGFQEQAEKMGDISMSFQNWDYQTTEDGLKSIAIMCGNLITEKQEIIQKLSEKNNHNAMRSENLEWAKSEHEYHKSSLTKFLWDLTKNETWWQEKNKELESKDDLKQCFSMLDSKETDSPEEIKAKFRGLIKFYHPDNFQNNPEKRAYAEKKTKEINNAYDKLHERVIL
jgi:hypothetical protein